MKKLNLMFCILMSLMAPLYAQTSLNENIALNKPVFVSSIEHGGTPAAAAVDGNLNSRWSSQFADPQWIYVDLGAFYDITQVRITWEAAMARNYRLEVSNDGMNWGPSAITTVSNNSSLVNTHTYTNVSGRFLRMFGTARVTPFGYSIYELEVFGTINQAPNITLTNLTSLQRFSINDNIVFTADASDPDGTIASVQFRLFGNVVGTDNTAPYEFAWTNANVGFFTVSAVAIDNQGATTATTAITISVVNNSRPSVSLTAPAGNSIYSAPAAITLRANASDLDGTISSVRFFANGTSLGIDNSAPYEFNWSNVAAGNYTITAVATDNSSLTTTSSAVNIIVNAVNPAPNIALNKTVVASSIEHGGTPVHAAVDGDLNSRWSSQFADPQWIYVDLGASYSINEIKIIWETAMARDYVLEISNDFNSWGTPVIQVTNNSSVVNTHAISNISGRYVRMYGTARTTPYGYSIYELEVYGTPSAARVAAGNVEAEESANILKAFPIPAIDALTITGKTAANEAEIQLLNQMGTLLKTERYESGDQLLNKTISVSDLSEGFYFIKIISGGKTESIRFNK
ncbi:MAG: discoidin domain-containing protein [Cytophagaceae bacterium]|nr:discoidin domain-containing protein [Cytophagaceae bacterium]